MARRRPPGQAPGSAGGGWPPFRRLAWVQVAHAGGDALVAVALADTLFFSVPLGQARDKVGLYLGLTMAPFALLAPVMGPLIDRRRGAYRLAVVAAALGRALLAGLLSSRTDRLELYPLAFGLLVLSRVHGVSRSALPPGCVGSSAKPPRQPNATPTSPTPTPPSPAGEARKSPPRPSPASS